MPNSERSQVLQWAHTSRISCHPGVTCTLEVLKRRFWCPTMDNDTQEFVGACTICTQNKSHHQPTSGLLQPLPVPSRPWSYIAIDFVMGLPPSQGHMVILTFFQSGPLHYTSQITICQGDSRHPGHPGPSGFQTPRHPHGHTCSLGSLSPVCVRSRENLLCCTGGHGQTERTYQSLEAFLRCICSDNPSS